MNSKLILESTSAGSALVGYGAVQLWSVLDPAVRLTSEQALGVAGLVAVVVFSAAKVVRRLLPPETNR